MNRQPRYEKSVCVSLKIDQYTQLKRLAEERTIKGNSVVSFNSLVRSAIEEYLNVQEILSSQQGRDRG